MEAVGGKKGRLPKGSLSDTERTGKSLRWKLRLDLSSISIIWRASIPSRKPISRNYEPEVAGLNLSADVSASDLIRCNGPIY